MSFWAMRENEFAKMCYQNALKNSTGIAREIHKAVFNNCNKVFGHLCCQLYADDVFKQIAGLEEKLKQHKLSLLHICVKDNLFILVDDNSHRSVICYGTYAKNLMEALDKVFIHPTKDVTVGRFRRWKK